MKKFLSDFKEFALKGNVVDMAIGVVIGAAFGAIVTSLVDDLIMPLVALVTGGTSFSDLKYVLEPAVIDQSTGEVIKEAVTLNWGNFIQTTVNFIIIALSIFVALKTIMSLHKKKAEEDAEAVAAAAEAAEPTNEEKLLSEIRDLLKEKK